MNPDHLRAAIERIGIEKPSDYTLVMEEVERLKQEMYSVMGVSLAMLQDKYPTPPTADKPSKGQ